MADDKKPTHPLDDKKLALVGPAKVVPFSKVEFPNVPVQMTAEQFDRFEHALIKGFVTMGYIANGGRPTSPKKIEELQDLIETVEEL